MRLLSISLAIISLTSLVCNSAIAQSSPVFGVWKLNLAKSKFENLEAPKSETLILEPDGDNWVKVHVTGFAGDGSPVDFRYAYEHGDNAHKFLGAMWFGKGMVTTVGLLSEDQRVLTFSGRGADEVTRGRAFTRVYDKQ